MPAATADEHAIGRGFRPRWADITDGDGDAEEVAGGLGEPAVAKAAPAADRQEVTAPRAAANAAEDGILAVALQTGQEDVLREPRR